MPAVDQARGQMDPHHTPDQDPCGARDIDHVERQLVRRTWVRAGVLATGAVGVLALVLLSMSVGSARLGVGDVANAVASRLLAISFLVESPDQTTTDIVWELRLPRAAMATLAGASLAVSGAALQGLLRNPLVTPFTLGISSAAAFGASLAIVFGATTAIGSDYTLIAAALACSLACAAVVLGLSWSGRLSPVTLILVGIALSYLFSALTATLQLLGSDEQIAAIVRWTFGSVDAATWHQVTIVGTLLAAGLPLLLAHARALDALAFTGEDSARALGVNVTAVRALTILIAILLAAVVVSFCGVIAFIGLVAPHIARLLVGADHRLLLPASALCGAALLLAADAIGRTIIAPATVPVGIVVAYLGVPLFLQLIWLRRRELAT